MDVECYVIVAKIYDPHGTSEEYVKAYLTEREADTHVAGMREFKPNNEEYSIVMVPLRMEDAATAYRAEIEVDNAMHVANWKKIAERDAEIERWRETLEAVPLQAIFRFVHGTMYDPRANVDDYMPEHYEADRAAIDAWLRKELSADE